MELTIIEFMSGLFSLILIILSLYIGLYIASRYRKFNNKNLLFIGFAWCGVFNGWYPPAISFLLILLTGEGLHPQIYFLIAFAFMPIPLFLWMIAFTELLYKERQKEILAIIAIICILFDFIYIYYLIYNYNAIGVFKGPFDVEYKGFVSIWTLFVMITLLITGLLLSRESLKSENPENKLRGYFLAYAFIVYTIAAIADAMLPLDVITLPIIRILLISTALAFYFGWIMPDLIKKIFLKNN